MSCERFFRQVRRQLAYLCDDHGFAVVSELGPGGFGSCIAVFESDACRIRIVRARGDLHADGAPLVVPDVAPEAPYRRVWYDVSTLIGFLEDMEPTGPWSWFYQRVPEHLAGEEASDWMLAELATGLEPRIHEVSELLRSDVFLRRRASLERYREYLMSATLKYLLARD